MLRDYQQTAVNMLYDWFNDNSSGHPCIVMPTGSGKSHVIAALCKDALQNWPETRILMLTHTKELIQQNKEKMLEHWPNAPLGIYSAGIGRSDLGEPITFAGIQSMRDKGNLLGHIDLCFVDECHSISHKNDGGYRKLLNYLTWLNPSMRVIGLTASPYRLGHGLITDKPALFDALIEPVSIEELLYKKYLSPLRSKQTSAEFDLSGVHIRCGEFIESELQQAVNTEDNNRAVVQEIIERAGNRKAWLLFCTGVEHSHNIANLLSSHGVSADCITGTTPKVEREKILQEYKAGNIRALTNTNVLTTGFDHVDIDLIAMLRPTMSPGLYLQMCGRGMRIAPGKEDCLVLDFAGNIRTHGPITNIQPPKKPGQKKSASAPVKTCEQCNEIVHAAVRVCPACQTPFPVPEQPKLTLHDDDIMGLQGIDANVTGWAWRKHISRTSGKSMLSCTYYAGLSDPAITEYLPVMHDGYAGDKAIRQVASMAKAAGISLVELDEQDLESVASLLANGTPPSSITYKRDGKFYRVLNRSWNNETTEAAQAD